MQGPAVPIVGRSVPAMQTGRRIGGGPVQHDQSAAAAPGPVNVEILVIIRHGILPVSERRGDPGGEEPSYRAGLVECRIVAGAASVGDDIDGGGVSSKLRIDACSVTWPLSRYWP
jgi:hypothetical protein